MSLGLAALLFCLWQNARAADLSFSLLLDTDQSVATGCTVAAPDAAISGVDLRVNVIVRTTQTTASVLRTERQNCASGTFVAPTTVDLGPWNVGLGLGASSSAVIELSLPLSLLPSTGAVRGFVIANDGTGIVDQTGAFTISLGAAPIEIVPVPLSPALAAAIGIALAIWGMRSAHRSKVAMLLASITLSISFVAWAASIVRDGNIGDWLGVNPIVTDGRGESLAIDLVSVFTQKDSAQLHVRVDAIIALEPTPVPTNSAPVVSAGAAQTVFASALPATANLSGTAADDGRPTIPGTLTLSWTKVSGPGTVTFANPTSAATAATFDVAGTYTLRLSAGDGALTTNGDISIVVNVTSAGNASPTVNAGQDQSIATGAGVAMLSGTVSDDGSPLPATLGNTWTLVSGPVAAVTFGNASSAATTVSLPVIGTYVLRLSATDGALTSTDDVSIVVADAPPRLGDIPSRTIPVGVNFKQALAGNDANPQDALSFALTASPTGAQLSPNQVFEWTPGNAQLGAHIVTARVTDRNGYTDSKSFTLTVVAQNRAPVLAAQLDTDIGQGASFNRILTATDPDGDAPLTFTLVNGPSGMTLAGANLSWPVGTTAPGTYRATVQVRDPSGLIDAKLFTLNVVATAAPVAIADHYRVSVGQTLTVPSAQSVLVNDVGSALTASKLSDPSKGSLSAFATDGTFSYVAPGTTTPTFSPQLVKQHQILDNSTNHSWQLVDLNADGHTDIVFNHLCFAVRGCITAFDIKNNVQLWTTDASADGCTLVWSGAPWSFAVGDIDDDGVPDIVMLGHCGAQNSFYTRIMAFDGRTGAMKWRSESVHEPAIEPVGPTGLANNSMLTIARLRSSEKPSVLVGRVAAGRAGAGGGNERPDCAAIVENVPDGYYQAPGALSPPHYFSCAGVIVLAGDTGAITQRMIQDAGNFRTGSDSLAGGKSDTGFVFPAMAIDFDGSGQNKIVMNGAVWNFDGTKFGASKPSHTHAIALGNFDDSPDIEIALVEQQHNVFSLVVKKADGRAMWSMPLFNVNVGNLTIADIDGDGKSEILLSLVLGTNEEIWAVDNRGRVRWIHSLPCLAGCQGSTFFSRRVAAFDLDGDGVAEVLFPYNSELRFLDGATGAIKSAVPILSTTSSYEAVARVADVDNDGHADVVLVSSGNYNCSINPACFANVMVFSDAAKQWRPTRKVDNQFAYFGANVNDDGTIPTAFPLPKNFASASGNIFGTQPQTTTPVDPRLRDQTSFTYAAISGAFASSPATVQITIDPPNRPPKFTSTPPTRYSNGFTYQAVAVDPDVGDTITYSITSQVNTPTCTISSAAGLLTCPFHPSFDGLSQLVVIAATDSFGAITLQSMLVERSTTSCTVPPVTGQTQTAASAAVLAAGCSVGNVDETTSIAPIGQVVSTSPAAGTTQLGGEVVHLLISAGPAPTPVPFVVGIAEPLALGALSNSGFTPQITRQFSSTAAFGQVLSQSPLAGTMRVPIPTQPVDIVISAGSGLELAVASPALTAGQASTILPIALDVAGNSAPLPTLSYVIAPKRLPYDGTLPTISGTTLSTSTDTRGWFTITATDAANGRTASAEFSVTLPGVASGRTNGEIFGQLMTTLSDMESIARDLLVARQANDVPRMTSLLQQYVNRWRTVDVDRLKLAVPMAFSSGFVPDTSTLDAAGLSATANDLLQQQILRDASADLQAWTAALKAGVQLPQRKALANQFAARAARSTGIDNSLYGAVMNNPELIQLLSRDIPEHYEAFTNELGVVVGLPRREPRYPTLNKNAPDRAKQTLAELLVTQAVDEIKDEIISRANETYKNIKQFAVEQRNLAIYNAGVVAASGYLKQYLYMKDVTELVSGASLSFRIFDSPFSFIEVESATRRHHLYSTLVIGPTLLTDLNTGITGLIEKFKEVFSYGRDAVTNPKRVKSTDDLFAIHDEFKDLVDGLIGTGASVYKKFAERLYQSPEGIELHCIFTSAFPCRQLMYPDGFKSVFEYAPPAGFESIVGIPAVILVLVQDQVSGEMFIKTVPFFPTPPPKNP